jgi:hypothetical protein
MRFRLSQVWIVCGVEKLPLRPVCWGYLILGLLVLTGGCKGGRSVKQAEVSGKVLFQGQPLPGGQITFFAVKDGFATTEVINTDGSYSIKAPVGEVQISVNNQMLRAGQLDRSHPQRPGKEEETIQGKYVQIPNRYAAPDRSGLTYTVKSGQQTHDVELNNTPDPPPVIPGT